MQKRKWRPDETEALSGVLDLDVLQGLRRTSLPNSEVYSKNVWDTFLRTEVQFYRWLVLLVGQGSGNPRKSHMATKVPAGARFLCRSASKPLRPFWGLGPGYSKI